MSTEKETVADIVSEMRNLGKLDEKSTDKIPRSLMVLGLRTYADRIEAATKLEKSQSWHHREMEELVLRHEKEVIELKKQISNSSAMREALTIFRKKIMDWYMSDWIPYDQYDECEDIAKSAISAPMRNCDRFGGDEVKIFDCYIQERKYCKYKDLFPDYGFWLLKTAKTKGEDDGR